MNNRGPSLRSATQAHRCGRLKTADPATVSGPKRGEEGTIAADPGVVAHLPRLEPRLVGDIDRDVGLVIALVAEELTDLPVDGQPGSLKVLARLQPLRRFGQQQ